jgi:hypothetical protein
MSLLTVEQVLRFIQNIYVSLLIFSINIFYIYLYTTGENILNIKPFNGIRSI